MKAKIKIKLLKMDRVSFLNSLLDKIDSSSSKDGGGGEHHAVIATTGAGGIVHINSNDKSKESMKDNNININQDPLHLGLPMDDPINRRDWFEYYDSGSGKYYYHDRISNNTTWDKPADFEKYFSHNRLTPITTNNSSSLSSSSIVSTNMNVDYRVVGTFNKVTGRFTNAGPESYWDQVIESCRYLHMLMIYNTAVHKAYSTAITI